jgi:hypothetical protein
LFDHYHFNVGDLRSVPKGKWSQFKRGRKVEGKRLRTRGKGSEGAAMAGPQNQNPRGKRLTPVLLKQGLVLFPPSLG